MIDEVKHARNKILTNRLDKTFDENQPREQAGLRSDYSTIDHVHTMNQLIEKTSEYKHASLFSLCTKRPFSRKNSYIQFTI